MAESAITDKDKATVIKVLLITFACVFIFSAIVWAIRNQEPPQQYYSAALFFAVIAIVFWLGSELVARQFARHQVAHEWGSLQKFFQNLTDMQKLKDISPTWSKEDWERYRTKDFYQNKSNFEANKDLLWKQWKRYEQSDFDPEIKTAFAAGYTKEKVLELMNLYVVEAHDRWHRANIKDYLP